MWSIYADCKLVIKQFFRSSISSLLFTLFGFRVGSFLVLRSSCGINLSQSSWFKKAFQLISPNCEPPVLISHRPSFNQQGFCKPSNQSRMPQSTHYASELLPSFERLRLASSSFACIFMVSVCVFLFRVHWHRGTEPWGIEIELFFHFPWGNTFLTLQTRIVISTVPRSG